MRHGTRPRWLVAGLTAALALCAAASAVPAEPGARGARETAGEPIELHLPVRSASPKSIDPVHGASSYDNALCSMVYEPLLQFAYLERPYRLEPLLVEALPEVSPDGRTYRFRLRADARFADDPCFPDGEGRPVAPADVFYSWKRQADARNRPQGWWLLENTVVGLDAWRDAQNAAAELDYDAPVPGLRILGEREFEVELVAPVERFRWVLAMFQTAVVPREAVERYGAGLARHPVGTGPFVLERWDDTGAVFARKPDWREERFPTRWTPEDEALAPARSAGKRLPLADRVRLTFFEKEPPMWLRFRDGTLDYTEVPADEFGKAFDRRTRELLPEFSEAGFTHRVVPVDDFISRQFNMADPLVGGTSERARALRKAIVLAIDPDEFNADFYQGKCIVYDGMIPPGMAGHPAGGRVGEESRGPDLARAREYLAQAGHPNGEGLPPIHYWGASNASGAEHADMLARQVARIGVKLELHLLEFTALQEAIAKRRAQMFTYAWAPDYPDAENFLCLFYGPNATPGVNWSNYSRPEYDRLYEQARVLPDSPERTALYERMRDMVLDDAVFAGSLMRRRYYLVQPRLTNFRPSVMFHNWVKYLSLNAGA